MTLREDIDNFIKTIPQNICVVAATKYVGIPQMQELIRHGITDFGENRTDSFLEKYEALREYGITWHFIGHLQRNKAKEILPKIDYLHSLDSLSLAKQIERERKQPLKCFIEVSVNQEENKNGVKIADLRPFIRQLLEFKNIELMGFMMMSKQNSTHSQLLHQFNTLTMLRDELSQEFSIAIPCLSMGMSDDYLEAIEAGATHIRLGRILWRN